MLNRLALKFLAGVACALLLTPAALFADRGAELNEAICDRDLAKVKRILAAGHGVNQRMGADGSYPLELAAYCYGGAPQIAGYLLDRGADVNLHSRTHYSVLMWALRSVDENSDRDPMRVIVKRILAKGADVRYQDPTMGRTALMMAASNGDEEIVRLLMDKGAANNPKTKDDWCISGNHTIQCSASDYARLGGHVELALRIEGKSSAAYQETLHFAAKSGDLAKLRTLLRAGKDPNETEPLSKYTPLYYAVLNDNKAAIRALAEAGADMNPVSYSGTTPLREAVVFYKRDVAKLLIDLGAKAGHAQTQGCGGGLTEFGWAIEYGQHDLAKYMVEGGAIDPQNPGLVFQEMYGRSEGDIPVARLLIEKGARPDLNDITRLKQVAANNDWIREAGHNAKLVALYEDAMRRPAPVVSNEEDGEDESGDDEGDDINEIEVVMPEIPEGMLQLRLRSAPPPQVKHRSMQARQAAEERRVEHRNSLPEDARRFDARFRSRDGKLSPDPLR